MRITNNGVSGYYAFYQGRLIEFSRKGQRNLFVQETKGAVKVEKIVSIPESIIATEGNTGWAVRRVRTKATLHLMKDDEASQQILATLYELAIME